MNAVEYLVLFLFFLINHKIKLILDKLSTWQMKVASIRVKHMAN